MQPQQGSSRQPLHAAHSSGETRTLGGSAMASYMDAWAALCTALGHVLRIRIVCSFGPTAGCARHPENLGGHTVIAFHPSSDWMRRLARSVITGESNSRVAFVVVVLVVVSILLSSSSSSRSRARGRRISPETQIS